jgi:hypothetical protein
VAATTWSRDSHARDTDLQIQRARADRAAAGAQLRLREGGARSGRTSVRQTRRRWPPKRM